jgi:hypothetical protein
MWPLNPKVTGFAKILAGAKSGSSFSGPTRSIRCRKKGAARPGPRCGMNCRNEHSPAQHNWGLTNGRLNTIAISPADPKLVLTGASTGGIWRSTDGGETFVPVSDDQVDLAVGSIAFAWSDPNVVYAGMGDAKGTRYLLRPTGRTAEEQLHVRIFPAPAGERG